MKWFLPFAIAHRGASLLAPENTLAALTLAKEKGAQAVEFDVQLTRDRQAVVFHDAELSRTSNGQGFISAHTAKQLTTLDAGNWFSKKFSAQRIPSLEEWLAQAKTLELLLNLEIKAHRDTQGRLLAAIVLSHLKHWPKNLPRPFISSSKILNHPSIQQGLIIEKKVSEDFLRACKKNNIVSLHQPYGLFDEAYIARIHAQGLKALAYTVNDKKVALDLKEKGIDGVFTDNHALYVNIR